MFSSVPLSILSAVLPVVLAQSSGSGSDSGSYVAGLVDHLNGLGYTEAASVLTKVNSTTSGQQWLSELPNGNYTAFVPDNAACDYFQFQYVNVIAGSFFFQFRICRWKFPVTMNYCRSTCRIISFTEASSTLPLIRLAVVEEEEEEEGLPLRSASHLLHREVVHRSLPQVVLARLPLRRLSSRGFDVKMMVAVPLMDSRWSHW